MNDQFFIERCSTLGKKAANNGNAPVGALITAGNQIICEAEENSAVKRDVTCHAELEAIRKAVILLDSNDLSACTLYTTHEPCVMCAYAIRYYRIQKVVYLSKVDNWGSISSDMPLLTTTRVPPHWSPPPIIIHYGNE